MIQVFRYLLSNESEVHLHNKTGVGYHTDSLDYFSTGINS